MSELGYIYLEGRFGIPMDRAEALKWNVSAAKGGWANAQSNLGYCYERGLGVEVDLVEAAKWYRLAARQTNVAALGSLGVFYMEGRGGLPRDHIQAELFLNEAVERGHVRSKLNLGCLYVEKGYRTNMFARGVQMIREAADAGDSRAQGHLAALYFHGKGVPKDLTAPSSPPLILPSPPTPPLPRPAPCPRLGPSRGLRL